jgi:hypothetical protein
MHRVGPQVAKLLAESLVAGAPINVQFMVKDTKKYTATGGWGFAQFTNGKAEGEAVVAGNAGLIGYAEVESRSRFGRHLEASRTRTQGFAQTPFPCCTSAPGHAERQPSCHRSDTRA